MSPAMFTNQDAAIVELRTRLAETRDKLAKVTAERDRARDLAVALEQEVADRGALPEVADLIDRLEGARDNLMGLAQRPTVTLGERYRLEAKREGVNLALSYAREYTRGGAA